MPRPSFPGRDTILTMFGVYTVWSFWATWRVLSGLESSTMTTSKSRALVVKALWSM